MHFFPQRVKNLLDNTEIFLMPTLNPDGFEESTFGFITTGIPSFIAGLGSSSRRRTNANLVDLNRVGNSFRLPLLSVVVGSAPIWFTSNLKMQISMIPLSSH